MKTGAAFLVVGLGLLSFCPIGFSDEEIKEGGGMLTTQMLDKLQGMANAAQWRTLDVASFERLGTPNDRAGEGLKLFSFGLQDPVWIYKAPAGFQIPSAALSPDGQRAAFWQDPFFRKRKATLYVMEIKTNSLRKVAEFSASGLGLCWSRDGRRIIFSGSEKEIPRASPPDEPVPVYLFDLNAHPAKALTKLNLSWPQVGAGIFTQGWSPDGSEFAYMVTKGSKFQVRIYNLAKKTSRVLADGRHPAWSPKGGWIAYVETDSYSSGSLHLISPDGKNHRVILQDTGAREGFISGPVLWSPDGNFLLVGRTLVADHDAQLPYILELSTGRDEQLPPKTCGSYFGIALSWAGE